MSSLSTGVYKQHTMILSGRWVSNEDMTLHLEVSCLHCPLESTDNTIADTVTLSNHGWEPS